MQWDKGQGSVDYTLVTGNILEYTLTQAGEGLIAGESYRFRYRASNKLGWGPFSDIVSFAAASIPDQASPVTTQIENKVVKFAWDYPNDGAAPILEYSIQIKTKDGQFVEETVYCSGQ